MRWLVLAALVPSLGCAATARIRSDATLGRVVVYKSGVAYFERYARIDGDVMRLTVPQRYVDDLLKSLTVTDSVTGAAQHVSFPSITAPSDDGMVEMAVQLRGARPHRLRLAYITEAPAWKPTYRVVLGSGGKVTLRGWAIVDNASGEDWTSVRLGVGSSSALSFRFDLRSLRWVERETLDANDRFAQAPPTGSVPYDRDERGQRVLAELADRALAQGEAGQTADTLVASIEQAQTVVRRMLDAARAQRDVVRANCFSDKMTQLEAALRGARDAKGALGRETDAKSDAAAHYRTLLTVLGRRAEQLVSEAGQCVGEDAAFAGETRVTAQVEPQMPDPLGDDAKARASERPSPSTSAPKAAAPSAAPEATRAPSGHSGTNIEALAAQLRAGRQRVIVEGYADANDADPESAATARAQRARDALVAMGVAPDRVVAQGRGRARGRDAGIRVVEVAAEAAQAPGRAESGGRPPPPPATAQPIGSSHFEGGATMNVARGSSAMLAIVDRETDGEVVYFYDPDGPRGSATFPFRALRVRNPTDSTLESGPVTVFGQGRFVGEGLCEPIPARGTAFVPFALDRQIVAERRSDERDEIARIVKVERGVFTTEVQHVRRTTVMLHNRMPTAATVYVRHVVAPGYALTKAPEHHERLGGADLIRIALPPSGAVDLELEETTPLEKTTDLRTAEGMAMIRAYVTNRARDSALRDKLAELERLMRDVGAVDERIATARAQIAEHRARMDELHAQVVTLRAAKSADGLVHSLEKKLQEVSDEVSRATIALVALQERALVARVRFEEGASELTLDRPAASR